MSGFKRWKARSARARLRAPAASLFLIAAVAAAGCSVPEAPSSAERPNLLFVISDDQSYPHASAYGAAFLNTPAFDRIAREGVLFHNAYVSTPSCGPSRGSLLTGQAFYRLREAAMNHTVWPGSLATYQDLLAEAGYAVGYTGKGWGPGNWQSTGRPWNPAGPAFNDSTLSPPGRGISAIDYAANFEGFLDGPAAQSPFSFWVGFSEPHRIYEEGIGFAHGIDAASIDVPGFLPDAPEVRRDLADYAFEIEYFDDHLARMLDLLAARGRLDKTLIVVTADNGMPFPRAKSTLYDAGVRVPMAARWGDRFGAGREIDGFVGFTDLAPTFLEAAGLTVPPGMTGTSLLPALSDPDAGSGTSRDYAVFGIERHFPGGRPEGRGYPMRGIRTAEYLYIRNLTPAESPAGDHPGAVWPDDDPVGGFGDVDGGPSKTYLWRHRDALAGLYQKAFGPRPAEELYAVADDPYQLKNLSGDPEYADMRLRLSEKLEARLRATEDPRMTGHGDELDAIMARYPVVGSNR